MLNAMLNVESIECFHIQHLAFFIQAAFLSSLRRVARETTRTSTRSRRGAPCGGASRARGAGRRPAACAACRRASMDSKSGLAVGIDRLPHQLGQLADGQVLAGADVDGAARPRSAPSGTRRRRPDRRRGGTRAAACRCPRSRPRARRRTFASWNLRISAGSTCELVRSKLSFGPYRFVGIAEMKFEPYCRR